MNLIQKKIQQREKTTEIYTVKIKKKKITKWKQFMSEVCEKVKIFDYVENSYEIYIYIYIYIINDILESKLNRNCNFTTI